MDYLIDAKNKRLGRVASEVALILQGKKDASYLPNAIGSDRALIKNYRLITVSGNKEKGKVYYRHTGYVGHLKEARYEEVFAKDPKRVLRHAIRKMLPQNFLNQKRLKNLIFVDDNG